MMLTMPCRRLISLSHTDVITVLFPTLRSFPSVISSSRSCSTPALHSRHSALHSRHPALHSRHSAATRFSCSFSLPSSGIDPEAPPPNKRNTGTRVSFRPSKFEPFCSPWRIIRHFCSDLRSQVGPNFKFSGAQSQTLLGERTALLRPLSWWGGLANPPQEPIPAASGLWLWP